jgi:hypothetical protein
MARLTIASVLITLLAITPSASVFQNREAPKMSGFAIQITNHLGQSAYFLLSERESRRPSFTISPSQIVRRAERDKEQVSEVYLAASSEDDAWKIKVSVAKGEFADQGEEDVATYLVRENERVTVKEMERFGIRPFDLAVVRVNQAAAAQPEVRNRTESILVTNVEATVVPVPYRISLRNLSNKSVLALELNTYSGDQMLTLKWPQGTWDHPLIEPGGTHEEELRSAGRGQSTTYGYVPEQSTSIEISTVVFADGTYEGRPYLAAGTKADTAGTKTQLKRVLSLLQTASEPTDGTGEDVLIKLKEAVSLFSEDIDPAQLRQLGDQFPTLNEDQRKNLPNFLRAGLHRVKSAFLKEVEALAGAGRPLSGSSVREWISKTRDQYERWLSALGDQ